MTQRSREKYLKLIRPRHRLAGRSEAWAIHFERVPHKPRIRAEIRDSAVKQAAGRPEKPPVPKAAHGEAEPEVWACLRRQTTIH